MATNKESVSNSDTINTAEENKPAATNDKERYKGITNFTYIGPSLPGGRLKSLTTLNGTYAQITEYYQEAIALFPNVARLIVPVTRLAEAREKTQNSGNLLYNYYQEVAAAVIQTKGDEQ